jgi:16S rRNA (uracil1498-N3)-methyltransferase
VVERRFYTYPELVSDEYLILPEEEAYHAIKVLRLRPDDLITVIDGENVYTGRIEKISKKNLRVKIEAKKKALHQRPEIVLYQAFAKGKKADFIVEKATEAGVDEVIFFPSEYSVSIYDDEKIKRLNKIALQASKQSKRDFAPRVRRLERFELPKLKRNELGYLFDPEGDVFTAKGPASTVTLSRIYLFVGPEGGFSKSEKEASAKMGFNVVRLNFPVLRTETAALAAVLLAGFLFRNG